MRSDSCASVARRKRCSDVGVYETASTLPGGYTPICNACMVALCYDISAEEYRAEKSFWDNWRCRDCNGVPMERPDKTAPSVRRQRWYAGIGSRRTPPSILKVMVELGRALSHRGYGLRSGSAEGADQAFERGAINGTGLVQSFLPWRGFADRQPDGKRYLLASAQPQYAEAERIAIEHYPSEHYQSWSRLGRGARALQTRNSMQVLGPGLNDPVAFVVCWAPNPLILEGRVVNCKGGTGQAVRIAASHNIPVFHLGIQEHADRIAAFVHREQQDYE